MKFFLLLFPMFLLASCQKGQIHKKPETSAISVSGTFLTLDKQIAQQAREMGLEVSGQTVFQVKGDISKIQSDRLVSDATVKVDQHGAGQPDKRIYLSAKEDFGLPAFWEKHPTMDGRGVVVAAIDDGVSPLSDGLRLTTTGERKYIAKFWNSSITDVKLTPIVADANHPQLGRFHQQSQIFWTGILDETSLAARTLVGSPEYADINGDGTLGAISVVYFESPVENSEPPATEEPDAPSNDQPDSSETPEIPKNMVQQNVCVDSDADGSYAETECFGTFQQSGTFGHWDKERTRAIIAEYDAASHTLKLTPGERSGHGDGVASVMSGHQIANHFNGVAPGSNLIDYDFYADWDEKDQPYTIGLILNAFETAAQAGADVINLSFSLYFDNLREQVFMREALQKIVDKHNVVISFSAGNNGPGLGSLNRRLIYPQNVLVNGAFRNSELEKNLMGVSNLPHPGVVAEYSSRGPGPSYGAGPMIISPLTSLVHRPPGMGGGFRVFGGTSSASPASAGLAAVLISAVKQLDLEFNAGAVVHALRQSAIPLENTPFIDQGYGLPKIERAISIYKELISGHRVGSLSFSIRGLSAPDGQSAEGFYFRQSNLIGKTDTESYQISVEGQFFGSSDIQFNTLKKVKIRSDLPFLSHQSEMLVSAGTMRTPMDINFSELMSVLENHPIREYHATIDFLSENDQLLAKLPITIIKDSLVDEQTDISGQLNSYGFSRAFVELDANTIGLIVDHRNTSKSTSIYARLYDPNFVPVSFSYKNKAMIPTEMPGLYQLGIQRFYGSNVPEDFNFEITPVKLSLFSRHIRHASPSVQIFNNGKEIDISILATRAPKVVMKKILAPNENGIYEMSLIAEEAGSMTTQAHLLNRGERVYYEPSCVLRYADDPSLLSGSSQLMITENDIGRRVSISCKRMSSATATADQENIAVTLQYAQGGDFSAQVRLRPGMNQVSMSAPTGEAGLYNLSVSPLAGSGSAPLGEIEVVE